VLIATGSELPLAVAEQAELERAGVAVRVVSMPSTTVFDRQHVKHKSAVLPDRLPRVAIEAGVTDFWWKYVRAGGAVLGVDRFGESAPAADLYRHFGLTVDNLVATVRAVLSGKSQP
jgi:transketolase